MPRSLALVACLALTLVAAEVRGDGPPGAADQDPTKPAPPATARPDATGQEAAADRGAPSEDAPGLPLEDWKERFGLSAEKVQGLREVDAWLVAERARLSAEAEEKEVGFLDRIERRRLLGEQLKERLGKVLTADQVEEIDLKEVFPPKTPSLLLTLSGSVGGTFDTHFDQGPGRLSTFSYGGGVQATFLATRSLTLTLGVSGSKTHYDFSNALDLDPIGGDPFQVLQTAKLSLGSAIKLNRQWSVFLSTYVATTGEEGATFEDTLTYGFGGGITYAWNRHLSLGLGLSFRTRLEDSPQVIPLPIVNVQIDITKELKFSFGVPVGVRLTYTPIRELEISLTAGFAGLLSLPDARLDDRGFNPEGVVRQDAIPISLLFEYRPIPLLKLSLQTGVLAYRQYGLYDRRGDRVTKNKTDPTGFVQFSFAFTF